MNRYLLRGQALLTGLMLIGAGLGAGQPPQGPVVGPYEAASLLIFFAVFMAAAMLVGYAVLKNGPNGTLTISDGAMLTYAMGAFSAIASVEGMSAWSSHAYVPAVFIFAFALLSAYATAYATNAIKTARGWPGVRIIAHQVSLLVPFPVLAWFFAESRENLLSTTFLDAWPILFGLVWWFMTLLAASALDMGPSACTGTRVREI